MDLSITTFKVFCYHLYEIDWLRRFSADEQIKALQNWYDNGCDADWLENNLQLMANCGFRIYESEDYGYVFGIDGAGYDFYEHHWIPLYKARGLKWHYEEDK